MRLVVAAIFLLVQSLMVSIHSSPVAAQGLSMDYYQTTCPQAEAIARRRFQRSVLKDPTAPASLLRLAFHDCQVQVKLRADTWFPHCTHPHSYIYPTRIVELIYVYCPYNRLVPLQNMILLLSTLMYTPVSLWWWRIKTISTSFSLLPGVLVMIDVYLLYKTDPCWLLGILTFPVSEISITRNEYMNIANSWLCENLIQRPLVLSVASD